MSQPRRTFADLDGMVDHLVAALAHTERRFLLGIAGPPGAGKSTVAAQIAHRAGAAMPACVAPMDGFHLSNEALEAAGRLHLKGIPETFDAHAFAARLAALRTKSSEPVAWPTYDRNTESVVPGGAVIPPGRALIVVEGNYLLLDEPPWNTVRPLLDAAWYLDAPEDELVARLRARHAQHRSAAEAAAKVAGTDLPNARLVASSRWKADVIVGFG